MTIVEKTDSQRHRRDINLCKPASVPDATGFSGVAADETEIKPSVFFADSAEENSTPSKSVPISSSIGRITAQKPAISKDKEL
jgi:hypothetical protein